MNGPWWASEGDRRRMKVVRDPVTGLLRPIILPGNQDDVVAELRGRAPGYTPRWQRLHDDDPGIVLAKLFAAQLEEVRVRVDRLPTKAFVEVLRIAGVEPMHALPAEVLVVFEIAPAAPRSVAIGEGFQLSAPAADGSSELVTFETARGLQAYPGTVEEVHAVSRGVANDVSARNEDAESSFAGVAGGRSGDAMWIGIGGSIAPEHPITLGVMLAPIAGAPQPVSSGALLPPPTSPPQIVWEAFKGGAWTAIPVVYDDTSGLQRGGIVELDVPERWPLSRPSPLRPDGPQLRWLRVRIEFGRFEVPPTISFVRANMTRAVAVRTFRNEVMEIPKGPLGTPPRGDERIRRLRRAPVRPGSVILEVEDGRERRRWREVASLLDWGPFDEVFTLDPTSGEVTFGDGRHGARVPVGFRNVVAASYQVGGGTAGRIDADGLAGLRSSAPFVLGASNPLPAIGGTDLEQRATTLRRGPSLIRARGRAVAELDYEALAPMVPGAAIARAKAVSGVHPARPGRATPGVVGLFVVPSDARTQPPIAGAEVLRKVAAYLAEQLAPAGVEIVAAAPRFHEVSVEATATIDPAFDAGVTTRLLLEALARWFDPLRGGPSRDGWHFGGEIQHAALVRQMLDVPGVRAVERVGVLVDGLRSPGCREHPIPRYGLLWPGTHSIVVRPDRGGPS